MFCTESLFVYNQILITAKQFSNLAPLPEVSFINSHPVFANC